MFITGSTRGIGKAIALKAAKDGANIIITGKTDEPRENLPGTVYTAAKEVEGVGGSALAQVMDVRYENQVRQAIKNGVDKFGGIDVLINNASAISLTSTLATDMKRFDLMFSVNARGTFLSSKLCIPFLKKSDNPHILNMAPPLNLDPKWFKNHLAYTISKYGMSLAVLGMAEEFKAHNIAVNALWPKTAIATSAVRNLLGGEQSIERSRKPEIVAEAAYFILTSPSNQCTGNFFIDEEVLKENGITDFNKFAVNPEKELINDFFLNDE